MRWKSKKIDIPDIGEKRQIKKFLLFPCKIYTRTDDGKVIKVTWETRWLESAIIEQKYDSRGTDDYFTTGWFDEKFVN